MTSTTNQQITPVPGITVFNDSYLYFNPGTVDGTILARRLYLDGYYGYLPSFSNVSNMTLTSSTTPAIAANTYGTFYYITNSAFNTLILPSSSVIGVHWIFRNATSTYLSVNVTYTGTGGGGVSTLAFPPLNTITIMFASNTSGSAAYAFF
jgi:hypothetical protein